MEIDEQQNADPKYHATIPLTNSEPVKRFIDNPSKDMVLRIMPAFVSPFSFFVSWSSGFQ